ncbi:MAG: beta strand repeat-containing protein, partial [Phycisphaerae bacterium]
PGTLVKGGTRTVEINGYAGGFSGNFAVAGQQGMSTTKSGNLLLNLPTNNIANLTVDGFHTAAAANALNVSGALSVGANAGTVTNGMGYNGTAYVPVTTGTAPGALLVQTGATVIATTLRNNGAVAPTGGAAAIEATDIVGNGLYHAAGSDMVIKGRLANDGATPSTLRVTGSGSFAVNLIPTASSTATGGVEVQAGTLRVAPNAPIIDPLPTTGTIRTIGAQASALGAGSQAVNKAAGVLQFDAGSGAITQNSSIVNNGTVRVSGANAVTVTGTIGGTATGNLTTLADFQSATVPGLLEGTITGSGTLDTTGARPGNTGNQGIVLEPRMGQQNVVTNNPLTGWSGNTAFVYTGYFYDADGKFTFIENVDDRVLVSIDGVTRLLNQNDRVTSTASLVGQRTTTLDTTTQNAALVGDLVPISGAGIANNPNLPAGWHSIEIRMHNGGGGAGPWGAVNGFANNYGFGLNPDGTMALDGAAFFRPIDDGSGNLFRTFAGNKGTVTLDAGSTLNAGAVARTALINLPTTATLNLTNAAGVSDADALTVSGTGAAAYTIATGATNAIGAVTIPASAALNMSGGGQTSVNTALTLTGDLAVNGGTVIVNATSTGAGAVTVNNNGTLRVNGSVASSAGVTVSDGGAKFIAGSTQAVKKLDLSPGTTTGNSAEVANVTASLLV